MTSADNRYAMLDDRGVLAVGGGDRVQFLQGLVSNDVAKAGPDRAVYAALLTPQGKYLFDFFVVGLDDALVLDCERPRLEELKKRLTLYKLRADVTLDDRSDDLAVAALFGGPGPVLELAAEPGAAKAFAGGIVYTDPRLAAGGARAVLPREAGRAALEDAGLTAAAAEDYDRFRLGLGLPDGSRDLVTEKSILLESGFEELNGVDWDKGCYMGQELTARTKYRGLVKKRLVPVTFGGPPPAPGTPVTAGGKDAGEVRSSMADGGGGLGLALIRLDALDGASLSADGVAVTPEKPAWANF